MKPHEKRHGHRKARSIAAITEIIKWLETKGLISTGNTINLGPEAITFSFFLLW